MTGVSFEGIAGDINTMTNSPRRTSEIHALTSVRGVAAMWVVIFHAAIFLPHLHLGTRLLDIPAVGLGYMAVDLFFILSGFVLTMTQREFFQWMRPNRFSSFFLARMLRLYPLHWTILCLFVIAVMISPGRHIGDHPYTWGNLAATGLLVQIWIGDHSNVWNTPSWSIAAELIAYALFPLLFEATRRIYAAWIAATLTVLSVVALAIVFIATGSATLDHTWHLGIVRCILEFSTGVCLYRFADLTGRDRIKGNAAFVLGIAIVAMVILLPTIQLVAPLGFALLILACYAPAGAAPRLLSNPVALFLGRISFSIYLVHFLILIIADDLAERLQVRAAPLAVRFGWVAMQLVIILLFATATWRWIERPGQKLSHRLRQHLTRRHSPTATVESTG